MWGKGVLSAQGAGGSQIKGATWSAAATPQPHASRSWCCIGNGWGCGCSLRTPAGLGFKCPKPGRVGVPGPPPRGAQPPVPHLCGYEAVVPCREIARVDRAGVTEALKVAMSVAWGGPCGLDLAPLNDKDTRCF